VTECLQRRCPKLNAALWTGRETRAILTSGHLRSLVPSIEILRMEKNHEAIR
jgi:hypothetical protein